MHPSSTPLNPIAGYAPINGLQMYHKVRGSGDPVVLLHGSSMTISNNFNWSDVRSLFY